MVAILQNHPIADYTVVAKDVAEDLKQVILERDDQAGIPHEEVRLLRDSGLLPLAVPKAYGGLGASWVEAMAVIKTLATVDSATAQLYGYHLVLCATPQVSGTHQQTAQFYRETAQQHLFWANAINVRDTRLQIESVGDHYQVNGVKSFCTGAVVADRIICAAMANDHPIPVLFVLPRDRQGLSYNHDWDMLGQRHTASGSFTFDQVTVFAEEILGPPVNPDGAFATLLGVLGLLGQTYMFLGIAEGAFEAAQHYLHTQARPWLTANVEQATQDPYVLRHCGELWAQLQGANALANQVSKQVQYIWEQGEQLTHADRGRVAISVSSARTLAINSGLAITNRMFELMGARSAANAYSFDRYWRNLRTLSLHHPLDYTLQDIGNWVLNGESPMPSPYA